MEVTGSPLSSHRCAGGAVPQIKSEPKRISDRIKDVVSLVQCGNTSHIDDLSAWLISRRADRRQHRLKEDFM